MARELFLQPPRPKVDPVVPQDRPVYRVLDEKGFFGPDDTLHPEGSIIVLWDDPNLEMEPLNDMAKERFEQVATKLEKSGKEVADFNGRYFQPQRTKQDMLESASADARRVSSLSNPKGRPIMAAEKDVSDRIGAVGPEPVPETGAKNQNLRRAKIETIEG